MTQQETNTPFYFRFLILRPEIKKKNTNGSGSIEKEDVYRGYFNGFSTTWIKLRHLLSHTRFKILSAKDPWKNKRKHTNAGTITLLLLRARHAAPITRHKKTPRERGLVVEETVMPWIAIRLDKNGRLPLAGFFRGLKACEWFALRVISDATR